MRRFARASGLVLAAAGALTLIWALVVWQWQDPFTALYTTWQQHRLESSLDRRFEDYAPRAREPVLLGTAAEIRALERTAARFRRTSGAGQPIGRIIVPRLGLNMILVNGTDDGSLKRGPGRDLRTFMPGQHRLVYIAGHRTTYLAPFSHIDRLRSGDRVTIEVPYGTFIYAVTRHRIVKSTDLSVLRSPRHELVELQACHPRFFASHRYIAYARLLRVEPRGAKPFELTAQASGK